MPACLPAWLLLVVLLPLTTSDAESREGEEVVQNMVISAVCRTDRLSCTKIEARKWENDG